jgi:DNA-binding transcriptional regulator YhcF (GntR family)
VQRTDIDKFIGALSGRFSEGLFVTTANYGMTASKKASSSIPRVLTLSGDQVISIMLVNNLGLKRSQGNSEKFRIDPDYFEAFEAQKLLLDQKIKETRQIYSAGPSGNNAGEINDTNTINLSPEDDLISINALSYALRIDPNTLRRWIEGGKLQVDGSQTIRERSNYFVRRDRIEKIREDFHLQARPISSDEWRQEFLDYAKSRNLSKSYKPVLVKALFKLVDREGKAKMDDIVKEFRAFYVQRAMSGLDVEFGVPLLQNPTKASDKELRRLIIQMPLQRFRIKNYFEYNEDDDTVQIAPLLWQELRYYEIMDVLESVEGRITYYYRRGIK